MLSFRMMDYRKRPVIFLVINALVTAIVTGSILFFYDLAHREDCSNCLSNSTAEDPSSGNLRIRITSITGAGLIDSEQVFIENAGDESQILTGWTIRDSRGLTFTFPQLTLYPGGEVRLHSGSGSDKLPDLFWGRSNPVWQAGELAVLYDSLNIARAFFRVP